MRLHYYFQRIKWFINRHGSFFAVVAFSLTVLLAAIIFHYTKHWFAR